MTVSSGRRVEVTISYLFIYYAQSFTRGTIFTARYWDRDRSKGKSKRNLKREREKE